jgi:hypothetical protein
MSVVICVPSWTNAANVLRTGTLDVLRRRLPDVPVVIVSPLADDVRFRREFERPGVVLARLEPYDPGQWERRVYSVLGEQFYVRTRLEAARLLRERQALLSREEASRWRGAWKNALARAGLPRGFWLRLADLVSPAHLYADLFDRHRPHVVVSATAGLHFSEMPLLRAARRRGIPVMAVDLSWDHLTLKGHTMQRMDRLVVWNDHLRREAISYHGYAPAQLRVSGVPQFDHYFRREGLVSREAFFARIGADPARKLVTFATVPQSRHPYQAAIVAEIAAAGRDGKLGVPVTVLVRLHPQDTTEAYAALQGAPHVIVEKPFTPSEHDPYGIEPSADDRVHQANTLEHSDVVINMASTISIEACIFDTPVVNFSYEGTTPPPLPLAARRYYFYEHYKRIVAAGAVKVAEDMPSLLAAIGRYLASPEEDRDGRRRVIDSECGFTDGRAGERVGELVAEFVEESAAHGAARPARTVSTERWPSAAPSRAKAGDGVL